MNTDSTKSYKRLVLTLVLSTLVACTTTQLKTTRLNLSDGDRNALSTLQSGETPLWLSAGEVHGLHLFDSQGNTLLKQTGTFELLDTRSGRSEHWALTADQQNNIPVLFHINSDGNPEITAKVSLRQPNFQVDGLCLYRDADNNLFAFFLDGYGGGEQRWLINGKSGGLVDLTVKALRLPPSSETCTVHDASDALFIGEESFGVWRYPANADTAWERSLIIATGEDKGIHGEILDLAVERNQLWVLSENTLTVLGLSQGAWQKENAFVLENTAEAATFAVSPRALLVLDESTREILLSTNPANQQNPQTIASYPTIPADVETAPVDRVGDAADDPAIWLHPNNKEASRILGTNKKWGLLVYNLAGEEVQSIPTGHINNIDIRQEVRLGNKTWDIAVASNRSDNSIAVYRIDATTGQVEEWGKLPTDLNDVYGICLYYDAPQSLYTFINDKDGRVQQYKITVNDNAVSGKLVHQFALESQPEGCVVDDDTRRLFLGEEAVGVWLFDADNPREGSLIAPVAKNLVADVEGLAIAENAQGKFLVVSSQGDNSFSVFDTEAPFTYRGSFRIGFNAEKQLDGASETDGLAVTGRAVGGNYPAGLLVVQDGFNLMPEAPQNFKLVDWRKVLEALSIAGDN